MNFTESNSAAEAVRGTSLCQGAARLLQQVICWLFPEYYSQRDL